MDGSPISSVASPRLIGERLKRLRQERRLSCRRLAQLAAVSKSTVLRLESGACEAHPETLEAIAKALDVSYSELAKPAQPKIRVARSGPPAGEQELETSIPKVVVELLCSGRLGRVKAWELELLIRNSGASEFAGDSALLELELLFRRACRAMHDREAKRRFDDAFERIRRDLGAE